MLMRTHGMRRLVLERLTTEERGLAGSQDRHQHQTGEDQSEPENEHQPDSADAGAAAVRRVGAVPQGDDQDEEEPEPAKQREQELEDEVERAVEELVTEEPDATEGRQAVVEADHDAQGVDGVGEHTL